MKVLLLITWKKLRLRLRLRLLRIDRRLTKNVLRAVVMNRGCSGYSLTTILTITQTCTIDAVSVLAFLSPKFVSSRKNMTLRNRSCTRDRRVVASIIPFFLKGPSHVG